MEDFILKVNQEHPTESVVRPQLVPKTEWRPVHCHTMEV
jgi:hypothetical protein